MVCVAGRSQRQTTWTGQTVMVEHPVLAPDPPLTTTEAQVVKVCSISYKTQTLQGFLEGVMLSFQEIEISFYFIICLNVW